MLPNSGPDIYPEGNCFLLKQMQQTDVIKKNKTLSNISFLPLIYNPAYRCW